VTDVSTRLRVTVRYFAAARAAAGTDDEALHIEPGAAVVDVIEMLGNRHDALQAVLGRCSYLVDGVAVRDSGSTLRAGQTIDVLPPFAGG
jgi:molybdopterin converting factor small subunit